MKKIFATVFVIGLVCSVEVASAYVIGSTNFGVLGYPESNCIQPMRPYSNDEYAIDIFSSEVNRYRMCIKEYVEAAENDAKRAIEASNDAINEYNAFINSL